MKRPVGIEEVLGVACMVVLVLLTLGNVLTRYLTDESFAWTEEISIFLIVVMTLAGAASIAARDRHIRIEFLYDSGSARRRRVLRLVRLGEFKRRQAAPGLRISERAFGTGWRMPVARAGWSGGHGPGE